MLTVAFPLGNTVLVVKIPFTLAGPVTTIALPNVAVLVAAAIVSAAVVTPPRLMSNRIFLFNVVCPTTATVGELELKVKSLPTVNPPAAPNAKLVV